VGVLAALIQIKGGILSLKFFPFISDIVSNIYRFLCEAEGGGVRFGTIYSGL
jgi:hypothetical protein